MQFRRVAPDGGGRLQLYLGGLIVDIGNHTTQFPHPELNPQRDERFVFRMASPGDQTQEGVQHLTDVITGALRQRPLHLLLQFDQRNNLVFYKLQQVNEEQVFLEKCAEMLAPCQVFHIRWRFFALKKQLKPGGDRFVLPLRIGRDPERFQSPDAGIGRARLWSPRETRAP